MRFLTERHHFITEERDVTTLLNTINSHMSWFTNEHLAVGNCGWAEEESKWFVHFDCTSEQYDEILKDLIQIGRLYVTTRPKGQRDLNFERA